MTGISEICRRLETGPKMSAEIFDLDVVYANARILCEKYGIVYDPTNPVPSDDDLADRTFQAPVGKRYQDCYDIETGLPCQEYISLYGEVKEELRAMGFDFRQ